MRVRALVDIFGTMIKSGEFFDCPKAEIEARKASGEIDVNAVEFPEKQATTPNREKKSIGQKIKSLITP